MSLKGSHVSAVVNAPAYPLQPLLTRGNGGEGSCDQARTDKTLVSIHFTYYTPLRLICMWKSESALCHICQLFQGTFIHMVWECPKIRPLWSQVTEFMADHFGFPNICNPLLCLLGAINDEKNVTKQFIRLIRFYVRKPIAIRWIYTETFTLAMWEKLVNADPTLYKMTYEHGYALKNVPNLVPVEGLSSYSGRTYRKVEHLRNYRLRMLCPGGLSRCLWGGRKWGPGLPCRWCDEYRKTLQKVLYAVLFFFVFFLERLGRIGRRRRWEHF